MGANTAWRNIIHNSKFFFIEGFLGKDILKTVIIILFLKSIADITAHLYFNKPNFLENGCERSFLMG